ncbi:PPP4R2-domain-containing protein [Leucosporidium creatinivorum]|uniref:PPP4R2-domain-containing protein n=1 Tax=Leucosporidium creatinivorum TaxID=106004 RepID=A0A1Y2FXX0_9BASI|nr:PPP4R2-domain-containing protein [Leucosporidium creatinivorum]
MRSPADPDFSLQLRQTALLALRRQSRSLPSAFLVDPVIMSSSTANGFTAPPLAFEGGFEWMTTYDELLEQIAATNVVDAEWSILRDMIKHKLAENIKGYLALGPPWPLSPEEAYSARTGACEVLDGFTGPPFTIQRLCELVLYPRKHYTSLPKYLRALNRVISVSSDRSAFTEDDSLEPYASTSATTLEAGNPSSSTSIPSPMLPTRRPAAARSPASSPRALPVAAPLLSPIPWLVKDKEDDLESVDDMDLSSAAASSSSPASARRTSLGSGLPLSPTAKASLAPTPHTQTPTGGVVDEVDPGSGGAEIAEPVALSSATSLEASKATADVMDTASLRERFVRASSPRVELSEEEDKSKEPVEQSEGGASETVGGEGEKMETETTAA